ncbi:putative Amine oxidase [Candidatus Moduliflexus flocculans]|uniref:Putative Amine oxidase n=1 Tax=Candidatus Moduliflexus flocculans TaxID=1499966 RepID=A0A081BNZ6_9BACT|nr:putative Amine oxidase [Candidatus Moduliflexus flocculans]
MKSTIILGAGLTGLSAAYHLGGGYDIFEREADVGGLCRTMRRGDFCFDYTGHLLHLRSDYAKQLVQELLPDAFALHSRKASIFTQGRLIPYPFQANIAGLPPEIIKECLIGFIETLNNAAPPDREISFQDWALRTFGAGVAKYFMLPYNQKLWKIPLTELGSDWVSWSIPKPTLDEFLNGALGIRNRDFGYNPTFLYPKHGGIEQLPQAFAQRLDSAAIHLNAAAVRIDEEARRVFFADGASASYRALISTLPLKTLVAMLTHAPEPVRAAADRLRAVTVYDINVGVDRADLCDQHWLYFPEPEYVFYRVGFPSNFSNTVAPPGCCSMYVEVSAFPDEHLSDEWLREHVLDGLRRSGILRPSDTVLLWDVARIECGYALYDLSRSAALKTIGAYLEQRGILSVGRYGAWEYNSMEGAILAGKEAAEQMKNR